MRALKTGVAMGICALLLASCGASSAGGGDTSATPGSEESSHASDAGSTPAETSAAPEPSPSETGTEESSSETANAEVSSPPAEESSSAPANDDNSAGDDGEDGSSPVLGAEKRGATLNLSNFFRPDTGSWSENRYDVADKPDVNGIAGRVRDCGDDEFSGNPELELRLANNFQELSFYAGQANDSESSTDTLVVKIVGNGGQIDTQRIPFNKIATFKVPVKGVNSLKIQTYLDDEVRGCGGDGTVHAVLWGFQLR